MHRPFLRLAPASRMLLAALTLAAAGCSRRTPAPPAPTPVRVVTPVLTEEVPELRFAATLAAQSQVTLVFRTGGYVESIAQRIDARGAARPIEVGDVVAAGEPLATVRQQDYADQLAQAEGVVGQAQAAAEKAAADFDRAERLFAATSLTQVQFDAYKAQRDASAAALKSARAVLAQAGSARHDSVVRAPFPGRVVQRQVEVGALVGPATPAFVVADTRTLKVVFAVADTVVGRLHAGDRITLSTASQPESFPGEISAVAAAADARTRLFAVEALIANVDGRLKPGLVATVILNHAGPTAAQLTIPLSALVRSSTAADGFAVFVVETNQGRSIVRERPVTLGPTVGNRLVVRHGLTPADAIVAVGVTDLHDGATVAIVP
ncbi:efflux RND transporter periplasmic adaptor subunit [Opitutus sp. ER46]|uniref:efflux RND transporter periplasmic adaptor subunit n=1 Tax=Opitutus sp. ER46 TaxID=2161864 RepID=UPI000D3174DD|nr:efflux RND transporter periplasmic adaptor subunit [Opitutus sp. ER46]PTX97960.1 hypothetical protein DB354_06735 [Opitutus sp. ER46]